MEENLKFSKKVIYNNVLAEFSRWNKKSLPEGPPPHPTDKVATTKQHMVIVWIGHIQAN